jgi:putative transposase
LIKSIKVMLLPNNKQETKMFQFCGASRFAYNWTLKKQEENYKLGNKFISDIDLRREFTKFKQDNIWLYNISNDVTKQAIKDACHAYKNFFVGKSKYPKLKKKKSTKPSFYIDTAKIEFTSTHVKFESIANNTKKNRRRLNWIKLAEKNRIPIDCKYMNPRCTFDGLNFWLSVSIEVEDNQNSPTNEGIGIDLGIKDLAICSDRSVYKNINKTKTIKKVKKKLIRLQRKVSRKYLKNKNGNKFVKTKNIEKLEINILKLHKRLSNIRENYLHQTSNEIISRNSMFITLEDLNISGMMKNRHLSKVIQEQCLYKFKQILIYKAKENNISVRQVNRFYPSSKLCNSCGCIHKELKLKDRVYECKECGYIEDRDLNASFNLKDALEYIIL